MEGPTGTFAEHVKAVRDHVDTIRATGYSRDGLVTAVVGGRGELVDLELDPRVYRDRDSAELASRILTAIHDAAADAERAATTFAERLLPPKKPG